MIPESPLSVLRRTVRAIAPPPGDRDGPLVPMLLALTVVTGLVDAFSYLVLGHVFVANMTGNVVFLGFALAGTSGFSVTASLIALAAFALGAVGGGKLNSLFGVNRARHIRAAAAMEAALIGIAVIVRATVMAPGRGAAHLALIVVLGIAMGIQNSTARKLAVPDLTTTVLTLTITGMFADAPLVGGAGSRVTRRTASAGAVFLGAAIGAALVGQGQFVATLTAAAALVACVAGAASFALGHDSLWAAARG